MRRNCSAQPARKPLDRALTRITAVRLNKMSCPGYGGYAPGSLNRSAGGDEMGQSKVRLQGPLPQNEVPSVSQAGDFPLLGSTRRLGKGKSSVTALPCQLLLRKEPTGDAL